MKNSQAWFVRLVVLGVTASLLGGSSAQAQTKLRKNVNTQKFHNIVSSSSNIAKANKVQLTTSAAKNKIGRVRSAGASILTNQSLVLRPQGVAAVGSQGFVIRAQGVNNFTPNAPLPFGARVNPFGPQPGGGFGDPNPSPSE